ncbi:squalene/phytoene synthase family protein [Dongia soli]|uniref:Squalene/phytoene synthase family protein n=1 Tax=Dongia soli TaxID=600628 RepID=A0ABU5E8V5_9PROT|nr:squalene/phytoene synthase family protein [Dongia soli]MDY0882707.1 squalene/phytoene synthase family protein [Dongia soli]
MTLDPTYCLEQLGRWDRDRYLTILAAPSTLRTPFAILAAFNLELARVSESVSEQMLGLIRLQWWRDVLDEIAGGGQVRRHAVSTPLAEIVREHHLPIDLLEAMISARENDIDPAAAMSMDETEIYLDATAGNLIRLSLQVSGLDVGEGRVTEMARHAGIAYGLTGLIRATLFHAQSRRLLLPRDVLERHGVDLDRLTELKPQAALPLAITDLAQHAAGHLGKLRALTPPRQAVPALLVARLAALQLERLKGGGYDLFDYGNIANAPTDIWRLLAARFIGRL